jgi:hypothetical protein
MFVLGFNHFYAQSPYNTLIEDYTQIFYMIHEGDMLSIQCKMSLREPKFMRKVNGLSLIFIDFFVPAYTPRVNSIETLLQLSESTPLFASHTKSEAELLYGWPFYSHSIRLAVKPFGTHDQRFFFFK